MLFVLELAAVVVDVDEVLLELKDLPVDVVVLQLGVLLLLVDVDELEEGLVDLVELLPMLELLVEAGNAKYCSNLRYCSWKWCCYEVLELDVLFF